ncbi:MAG: hypothetical protein ACP5PO_00525 [Desulfurella sp.]|uniref:hypothetical protein n=1 Tax=Desulfurella sp. TaxID=1962857 RepID=UPI003D0AC358
MKDLKNQKGIALIVAILLSFMALTLISALMWLVISGTKMSGMYKQYASAHDAAIGGAEVIIDALYWGQNPSLPDNSYNINDQTCFRTKRENPIQYWGNCLNSNPDLVINFGKINSSSDYYTVNVTITSTTIAPPCAASSSPAKYYYSVSIDATNSTRLDKSGLDFVYALGK